MRDGLQLEGVLLRVMGGEDLVEDDERTVAVARGQHQRLPIGRPRYACVSVNVLLGGIANKSTHQDMSVNSS